MAKTLEEKMRAAAEESRKLEEEKRRAEREREEYSRKIQEEQKHSHDAVSFVHKPNPLSLKLVHL